MHDTYALVNINPQGPPPRPHAGRPRGFWHLMISPVKVLQWYHLYLCLIIPCIPYPRGWESLYFKHQNCPWVFSIVLILLVRCQKLLESLGFPWGAPGNSHTAWCIANKSRWNFVWQGNVWPGHCYVMTMHVLETSYHGDTS